MKEGRCNWRGIGSLVVITVCLVSVMSPALTQSSFPLFNNASNTTNGKTEEIPEPTPATTPTPLPTPTPVLTPTPSPTPTQSPSPNPSPSPIPTPTPCPTPAPTPMPTPTPSPTTSNITSFTPNSSVCDIEGATRTFNVTIDQVVNVSWLFIGTEVQTNESVTEASYTNTNAAVGTWNVSAVATNENGTEMQTWIWNVSPQVTPTPSPIPTPTLTPTPTPSPEPTQILSSNAKPSTPFYIYGYVSYENGSACNAPFMTVTNLDTSEKLIAENHTESNFYQLITNSAFVKAGDVIQIEASKNGAPVGNATHTVTSEDLYRGVIEVGINEEWALPDLIISEISTPPLLVNKTNTINVTVWNNGTGASGAFNLAFSVSKGNETEYENGTRVPGLNRSSYASISFSWEPTSEGSYNITVSADYNHEVNESNELNNNLTMTVFVGVVPDFTVTYLNISNPRIGDVVKINATIANLGVKEGTTNVEFYDNKSIEIKRTENDYFGGKTINDILTLPGVLQIRVHFSHIGAYSNIKIYDKNYLEVPITDNNWTGWASGDTIRIESQWAKFTIDRYEAVVLANGSVPLSAGNSTNISANWNLSLQEMGWATSGEHNITVIVDPYNNITESDEENNTKTQIVVVNASLDFAVTDFNPPTECLLYDTVEINVTIANFGVRNGTTFVEVFYDNRSSGIEKKTNNDTISLPPGVLGARLHFDSFSGYIAIYDKNWNMVEKIRNRGWTNCIYSDVITIKSSEDANFKIDRYEALILNEPVTLNASENKTLSVDWIANTTYGGAGPHNITVHIDPHNSTVETCKTNNNQTEPIFVNGTDLAITKIEMPCVVGHFGERCYRGKNVSIKATIANLGACDAPDFTISFKDGLGEGNTSGVDGNLFVPSEIYIPPLASGENRTINVTWTPSEFGKHTITVSIPFDNTDNYEMNNERFVNVSVKSEYDFSVENVTVTPGIVNESELVNITATIANWGLENESVNVSFYVNVTDFAGSGDERYIEIGKTEQPVYVEVGNTNSTPPIPWNANIHGGDHLIYAVVDPDNNFSEWPDDITKIGDSIIFKEQKKAGNNVKNCTLRVTPPQLNITNLTLDPARPVIGEEVNVTAIIENEGNETANSTVQFYMEKEVSGDWDDSRDWQVKGEKLWYWSVSQPEQPEDVRMRLHVKYIEIISIGIGFPIPDANVNAAVDDGQLVYFYVKSGEVADGQPVKVSEINRNTPCAECMDRREEGGDIVCAHKRWADIWTDWSYGKELIVDAQLKNTGKISLLIDKYQVQLGNRTVTVTLNAGESKPYNVTWNALPLKVQEYGLDEKTLLGENYTFVANVEDVVLRKRNETYLGGTDLAVTDINISLSAEGKVLDATQIWINATIENLDRMNATAFIVNFTEVYVPTGEPPQEEIYKTTVLERYNNYTLINTTYVKDLQAGNKTIISVSEPWNASIQDIACEGWCSYHYGPDRPCPSWHEIAENYMIKVEIIPLDNENIEIDKGNNVKKLEVHINRSRDFKVTNLSFSVNGTLRNSSELVLGEPVTLNATLNITDLANRSSRVNVSFYLDVVDEEHRIRNTTVPVPFDGGNGTEYAVLNWFVWNVVDVNIAGEHSITVIADPENEIHELNESNNASTWQIYVKAPELTVTNLTFDPESPEGGETVTVNIEVTIANYGDKNATDVNLSIYDWAGRYIDIDVEECTVLGHEQIEIKRENATAMRLYLDLEIEEYIDPEIEVEGGGEVCIYDNHSRELKCYNHSFHGWTPWMLENNITVETIKEVVINKYLFSWDNVPGNESERLRRFLTDDLDVEWAENAEINKTDDNRTIHIFTENNSANLTLDAQNETATLEISDGRTLISLKVKDENGKLKIYNRETRDTDVYAKVSKVYYLEESDIINRTTHDLEINETANITVEWSAPTVGERFIAVIIDPENNIPEHNESNNTFLRYLTVQTADLEVSNLSLSWQSNGTSTLKDGNNVTIFANVSNIGIENTSTSFDVRFTIDDVAIKTETIQDLANGSTKPVVANWTAEVGAHVIKVEADYKNEINETNETNNINAKEIYVHGAEVIGNTSWESLGLHGLNGTILFDPAQPYDEDNVNITANITNSGDVNATNFSVALLFDYEHDTYPSKYDSTTLSFYNPFFGYHKNSNTKSYDNAICIYVYIDTHGETLLDRDTSGRVTWHQVFIIKDKNDTEVARTDESCRIHVPGDTVKIERYNVNENFPYIISFYPVYEGNLTEEIGRLNINSSRNITITERNVTAGNHTVMLFIDPENKVPEDKDNKTDNIVSRVMRVNATRDFTVINVNVTAAKTNLSDLDTPNITAEVANIGFRNGTADVRFVDYENETRIYNYYFDENLSLSYLPIPPDAALSGPSGPYTNLMIIHRPGPGVDAIQLHFNWITLYKYNPPDNPFSGVIWVCDKVCDDYRKGLWTDQQSGDDPKRLQDINIWVPGDTAYIYTTNADFELSGYTTKKELHCEDCENVTLNASVTWNESKNITAPRWNAFTGNHTITVTIDPDNEISEINESNNESSILLSVNASRDAEIVELNITPLHPTDGDNVTITAVVQNKGTKTANFTVDLWADTTRKYEADSPHIYVPDASWICVHHYYQNEDGVWMSSIGDTLLAGEDWYEQVDKIRYIRSLTRENVSVEPGQIKEVNATWYNISVFGDPTYVVTATVDPLDEIDEINESKSNNELSSEIVMDYPDFTVVVFNSPTRETNASANASVNIRNQGPVNASGVNVSIELTKREHDPETTGSENITNETTGINITKEVNVTKEGATKIRIHFASLDTTATNAYIDLYGKDGKKYDEYAGEKRENVWTDWVQGDKIIIEYSNADFYIDQYGCENVYVEENASKIRLHFVSLDVTGVNSYLEVYGIGADGEYYKVEEYSENLWNDVWTPWIKGNTSIVDYVNADFYIDQYEWGDVEIKTIDLNASERKNVSLPACWNEYRGVEVLNVTVDPGNKITEQKEDNNTRIATIYVDLMPTEMRRFPEDGKLEGIEVTILNNKTIEEERGIIFPVYNFTVELRNEDLDESVQTIRIGKNKTLYGGEDRNETFKVNESVFAANRTYNVAVIVDSEKEIEEINETNNVLSIKIGPDISVGEIYPKPIGGSCRCKVGAVIKNEGSWDAANFKVTLYLNSTISEIPPAPANETIVLLPPNKEKELLFDRIVEPNQNYTVRIIADPDNTVEELNEGNNEKEEKIGPDLKIERINYYSEKGAQRGGDKLIVGENQEISILVNNSGKVGAEIFDVEIWINSTTGNIYNNCSHVVCALPGENETKFPWTPQERGWFILNATVDLDDDVPEWNDEGNAETNNNKIGERIKVGSPGYKAKEGFLDVYGGREFNGGIIYTAGNSYRLTGGNSTASINTSFGNPIPEGANKSLVRLYVYPDWAYWPLSTESPLVVHRNAFLPDSTQLAVTFNGGPELSISNPTLFTPEPNAPGRPIDVPDATQWNASYATYRYDYAVTDLYDDTKGANNLANAERRNCGSTYTYGIEGMALLIVYEDSNAPLIRYWVAEDRDVIYAKIDNSESTGFEYENCTRKVAFNNVTDAHLANATLKTVLVSYNSYKALCDGDPPEGAEGIADALYFNDERLEIPLKSEKGHWSWTGGHAHIALTTGHDNAEGWEYVDVHDGTNYAAIQSRGTMMGFAHAILKVAYPPDLEPSVKKDLYATVGNPYDIVVYINNLGKSKAKNFNVSVSIDGEEVLNETIGEIKGVQDGDSIPLTITKKAPSRESIIKFNVTVVVDPEDKVKELINSYGNGEENNIWNDTVTVYVNPPGPGGPGIGGGTGGGWGEGNGTGEGSGSGEGRGVAGGTGEGAGESGGKTIRGRLMKGTVVSGKEAGGGGKGEFSLVRFLMQLVMLAAAVLLVCAGYLLERRRQKNKLSLEKKV